MVAGAAAAATTKLAQAFTTLGKEGMKSFAMGMESMSAFADKAQDAAGVFTVFTDMFKLLNPFVVPFQILIAQINAETIENSVDLMSLMIENMSKPEFKQGLKEFTDFLNFFIRFLIDIAEGKYNIEIDKIGDAFKMVLDPLGSLNEYLEFFEDILNGVNTAIQDFISNIPETTKEDIPGGNATENAIDFFKNMWEVLESFFGGAPDIGGQPGFGGSY